MKRTTMCLGKRGLSLAWLAISLCVALLACHGKTSAKRLEDVKVFRINEQEIPEILSGIWYHEQRPTINKPIEDKFSWGKTSYDYWTALRIDLLGGQRFFGCADATWDNATFSMEEGREDAIALHLGRKGISEIDEARVVFEADGAISVSFLRSSDTETDKMIVGKYYRNHRPR